MASPSLSACTLSFPFHGSVPITYCHWSCVTSVLPSKNGLVSVTATYSSSDAFSPAGLPIVNFPAGISISSMPIVLVTLFGSAPCAIPHKSTIPQATARMAFLPVDVG